MSAGDTFHVAVRRDVDTGNEWRDLETASYTREGVDLRLREKTRRAAPAWLSRNPVARIVECEVREVRR